MTTVTIILNKMNCFDDLQRDKRVYFYSHQFLLQILTYSKIVYIFECRSSNSKGKHDAPIQATHVSTVAFEIESISVLCKPVAVPAGVQSQTQTGRRY